MAAQYPFLYDNVVVNLLLNKTILSPSAKHLDTLEKCSIVQVLIAFYMWKVSGKIKICQVLFLD